MSEIQKSLKFPIWGGGGVKPIRDFSQIFPFFYDGSPKDEELRNHKEAGLFHP